MAKTARLLLASLLVVLAVAAAGCGGSSTSSTSTNATTTTGSSSAAGRTAATAAFQSCLTQHGVKLSGAPRGAQPPAGGQPPANGQAGSQPPAGAQGTPGLTAAQRRAFTACQSKLPANLRGRLGQRPTAASNPALAKYTACLRKHGVSFGSTNNQTAFRKASTACAKYAPKAGS